MNYKESKISQIGDIKQYEGQNGTIYYHQLKFENGDFGSIGKKKQNAFTVGQSLKYTIKSTERGNQIKEYKEPFIPKNTKPAANVSSFALSYAKDIMIAFIEKHGTSILKSDEIADKTIQMANKFNVWLKQNS